MSQHFILYPSFLMMFLTLFLYGKNYFDNVKAAKNKSVKSDYFKAYKGDVPEYIHVSRQTLKNQFELPILFYFLTAIIFSYNQIKIADIVFSWLFVISRYLHCYVRLTSNYIPYRAKIFQFGLFILIFWCIYFISICN